MTLFQLYLLTILDGLDNFFEGFAAIGFSLAFLALIIGAVIKANAYGDEGDLKTSKTMFTVTKWMFSLAVISMLTCALVPSTKQAMLIIGGYYVTNLDNIDKLPKNIIKAANTFLEEYATDEVSGEVSESEDR